MKQQQEDYSALEQMDVSNRSLFEKNSESNNNNNSDHSSLSNLSNHSSNSVASFHSVSSVTSAKSTSSAAKRHWKSVKDNVQRNSSNSSLSSLTKKWQDVAKQASHKDTASATQQYHQRRPSLSATPTYQTSSPITPKWGNKTMTGMPDDAALSASTYNQRRPSLSSINTRSFNGTGSSSSAMEKEDPLSLSASGYSQRRQSYQPPPQRHHLSHQEQRRPSLASSPMYNKDDDNKNSSTRSLNEITTNKWGSTHKKDEDPLSLSSSGYSQRRLSQQNRRPSLSSSPMYNKAGDNKNNSSTRSLNGVGGTSKFKVNYTSRTSSEEDDDPLALLSSSSYDNAASSNKGLQRRWGSSGANLNNASKQSDLSKTNWSSSAASSRPTYGATTSQSTRNFGRPSLATTSNNFVGGGGSTRIGLSSGDSSTTTSSVKKWGTTTPSSNQGNSVAKKWGVAGTTGTTNSSVKKWGGTTTTATTASSAPKKWGVPSSSSSTVKKWGTTTLGGGGRPALQTSQSTRNVQKKWGAATSAFKKNDPLSSNSDHGTSPSTRKWKLPTPSASTSSLSAPQKRWGAVKQNLSSIGNRYKPASSSSTPSYAKNYTTKSQSFGSSSNHSYNKPTSSYTGRTWGGTTTSSSYNPGSAAAASRWKGSSLNTTSNTNSSGYPSWAKKAAPKETNNHNSMNNDGSTTSTADMSEEEFPPPTVSVTPDESQQDDNETVITGLESRLDDDTDTLFTTSTHMQDDDMATVSTTATGTMKKRRKKKKIGSPYGFEPGEIKEKAIHERTKGTYDWTYVDDKLASIISDRRASQIQPLRKSLIVHQMETREMVNALHAGLKDTKRKVYVSLIQHQKEQGHTMKSKEEREQELKDLEELVQKNNEIVATMKRKNLKIRKEVEKVLLPNLKRLKINEMKLQHQGKNLEKMVQHMETKVETVKKTRRQLEKTIIPPFQSKVAELQHQVDERTIYGEVEHRTKLRYANAVHKFVNMVVNNPLEDDVKLKEKLQEIALRVTPGAIPVRGNYQGPALQSDPNFTKKIIFGEDDEKENEEQPKEGATATTQPAEKQTEKGQEHAIVEASISTTNTRRVSFQDESDAKEANVDSTNSMGPTVDGQENDDGTTPTTATTTPPASAATASTVVNKKQKEVTPQNSFEEEGGSVWNRFGFEKESENSDEKVAFVAELTKDSVTGNRMFLPNFDNGAVQCSSSSESEYDSDDYETDTDEEEQADVDDFDDDSFALED